MFEGTTFFWNTQINSIKIYLRISSIRIDIALNDREGDVHHVGEGVLTLFGSSSFAS